MPEELIIHLGDCKSGSTSIQTILFRKAWTSQNHTIAYPEGFNHIKLAKSLYQRNTLSAQPKIYKKIRKSILASDASTAILSGEAFEYVDPQLVEYAINTYLPEFKNSVRLISYFRPHAARLLASYSERVKKGGFIGSLEEFIDLFDQKKILAYAPRIRRWKNIFGDRYEARPMIPSVLKSNDVVHDFFSFALGDDDFEFTETTRHNESVSLQDLSVFRYIHQKLSDLDPQKVLIDQRKRFGSHLSMIMADIPLQNPLKLQLHKSLAQKVIDIYSDDAKKIDEKYFHAPLMQSALESAFDKALEAPQSLNIQDHCSLETIRMIDCWLELNYRMLTTDPKLFYMLTEKPGR
jgi:hypothetical protein